MEIIKLEHIPSVGKQEIALPSSKSESNRALIIQALAAKPIELHNLSSARDTQTMIRLLKSTESTLDVLDAGTTMRFLTAYAAVQEGTKLLTGTDRMQKRPIKILVDALRELGADIQYPKHAGYPPHQVIGLKEQATDMLSIRGDVSSQYISALLLIAPNLPKGLTLQLEGKVGSRPYIEMTLSLMRKFGADAEFVGERTIKVKAKGYESNAYAIESDWSGASYWYSVVALSKDAEIKLLGLREDSLQGDIAIVKIMKSLGVMSTFEEDGVLLTKTPVKGLERFDFSDCPDLAQTVAVVVAGLGVSMEMTGLESLKIKETDRVFALQQELKKIGVELREANDLWTIDVANRDWALTEVLEIATYDDHRMAMAFAPLALKRELVITDPLVVNKSYPSFWEDFQQLSLREYKRS